MTMQPKAVWAVAFACVVAFMGIGLVDPILPALAGASGSVAEIVGFRAGWGLGNALFIATALAVIIGAASGRVSGTSILFEAARGLGIASHAGARCGT